MKKIFPDLSCWLKSGNISSLSRYSVSILLLSGGYFIGGPVFASLLLSSLLITESLTRFLSTALAICTGIVFSLAGILVEFVVLVPLFRFFGPTRTFLFEESWIKPFEAREVVFEHLVELNQFGAVLIGVLPTVLAFVIFLILRKNERSIHSNPLTTLIAFSPLLIAVFRKARDPISYVVSTASGDGRNFFLHVQRIRVTSGFTGLSNFISQGDFGASVSSLVSDGLGSKGLFKFDDQYSIAAMYVLFGVLIASSVVAIVGGFASKKAKVFDTQSSAMFCAISIVAATLCVQMPWVMNEMFRSGFFSAVSAMALCAAFVATCLCEVRYKFQALMLLSISALIFVTYQIAAIYPLCALLIISLPIAKKMFGTIPIRASIGAAFLGLISIFLYPKIIEQMRTRLLLDGAITYLNDTIWLPILLTGAFMILVRGRLRLIGVIIFTAGGCTYGFQHFAQGLREHDGQVGYGYYGAKLAYIGLFIILISVISGIAAILLACSHLQVVAAHKSNTQQRIFSVIGAIGVFVLANLIGKNLLPEPHNFYQGGQSWTQPSSGGLKLALSYWDNPHVLFVKVTDTGNDRLINFWHPYFWSGDPWNWAYTGNSEDPNAVCTFISTNDVLVLTADPAYAQSLRQTCNASVKVL